MAPVSNVPIDAEPLASDDKVNVPELVNWELAARLIVTFAEAVNDPVDDTEDTPVRATLPGPMIFAVDPVLTDRPVLAVSVIPEAIVKAGELLGPNTMALTVVFALKVG